MRLCHRFGLKRVAKLLMFRDERHRSFFLFLAVLRAVVQGYVKNIETTYCGKNCRLLPRQVDAKPTTQSSSCRKPKFNDRSCINLDAMLTTQFSSCCKRRWKLIWIICAQNKRNSANRARTCNNLINSQVLCQLSYGGWVMTKRKMIGFFHRSLILFCFY